MNTREFSIGHHSDYPHDGKPQLPRVNSDHKKRGFPLSEMGYYVGYHFFIGEGGQLVQTRGLNERGSHADNCGCSIDKSGVPAHLINFRAIGICLAGDFTKEKPNPEQIRTLTFLVMDLQEQYGSRFLLHREVKSTSCPGLDYRPLMKEYEKEWLLQDLEKKQHALQWATGSRRTMLERAIARILKSLSPTP